VWVPKDTAVILAMHLLDMLEFLTTFAGSGVDRYEKLKSQFSELQHSVAVC